MCHGSTRVSSPHTPFAGTAYRVTSRSPSGGGSSGGAWSCWRASRAPSACPGRSSPPWAPVMGWGVFCCFWCAWPVRICNFCANEAMSTPFGASCEAQRKTQRNKERGAPTEMMVVVLFGFFLITCPPPRPHFSDISAQNCIVWSLFVAACV